MFLDICHLYMYVTETQLSASILVRAGHEQISVQQHKMVG